MSSHDSSPDSDSLDTDDPRIEQALRLGELRAKVNEITGGAFIEHINEDMPMDTQVVFWENVLAFEDAPEGTLLDQLRERCGLIPVPPEEITSENGIHEALWQLIEALAELRVYLQDTNHLSDRDLYRLLYDETLPEERTLIPPEARWNQRIDISESPTSEFPEPYDAYLAYFADDDYRRQWKNDFPEATLPPKRTPAYHRDHLLPFPQDELDNLCE